MTAELRFLCLAIALGFVHIVLQAVSSTLQRGREWNVGPRDEPIPPLTGMAGRLERASRNYQETFMLFAAVVLTADAIHVHNAATVWGAQVYFWARLVYLPLYAFGISYVRSLAWTVATAGIVAILAGLL